MSRPHPHRAFGRETFFCFYPSPHFFPSKSSSTGPLSSSIPLCVTSPASRMYIVSISPSLQPLLLPLALQTRCQSPSSVVTHRASSRALPALYQIFFSPTLPHKYFRSLSLPPERARHVLPAPENLHPQPRQDRHVSPPCRFCQSRSASRRYSPVLSSPATLLAFSRVFSVSGLFFFHSFFFLRFLLTSFSCAPKNTVSSRLAMAPCPLQSYVSTS